MERGFLIDRLYHKLVECKFPVINYAKYTKWDHEAYISNSVDFLKIFFPYYSYFVSRNLTDPRSYGELKNDDFCQLICYVMAEEYSIVLKKELEEDNNKLTTESLDIYERFINPTEKKIKDIRRAVLYDLLTKAILFQHPKGKKKKTNNKTEISHILDMMSWKETLINCISVAAEGDETYIAGSDKMITFISGSPDYISDCSEIDIWKWVDVLYYYVFYALTRSVHYNVILTGYRHWDSDMNEYNRAVVEMYDNSSDLAYFFISELANRPEKPNIIAMLELADKFYYGFTYHRRISYEKAYFYYKEVLKYHPEHPMALWSLAYMRFRYEPTRNLKYRVEELEKEYGENENWYANIVDLVIASYQLGCPPAANLIGKMLESNKTILRNLGSLHNRRILTWLAFLP